MTFEMTEESRRLMDDYVYDNCEDKIHWLCYNDPCNSHMDCASGICNIGLCSNTMDKNTEPPPKRRPSDPKPDKVDEPDTSDDEPVDDKGDDDDEIEEPVDENEDPVDVVDPEPSDPVVPNN